MLPHARGTDDTLLIASVIKYSIIIIIIIIMMMMMMVRSNDVFLDYANVMQKVV